MRLKSAIWVAAYIRRCYGEGAFAAVRRRGAEDAGAIFIKLNRLDGTAELFGAGAAERFDEANRADRAFSRACGERASARGEGRGTDSRVKSASIPMPGSSRSRIGRAGISSSAS